MKRFVLFLICVMMLVGCTGHPSEVVESTTADQELSAFEDTVPMTEPFLETQPLEQAEIVENIPATEAPEENRIAERITEGFSIFLDEEEISYWVCDDSIYSWKTIRTGSVLSIVSQTPFSALYFEWYRRPGIFSVEWEGGSLSCGTEGFLHDYVSLPEPVTSVQIHFGEKPVNICSCVLFTRGKAPEGIQDWQDPCRDVDILVFPTHSDDESLFFGALIGTYAIEQELIVQTAYMVDHSAAAWEREHERLNGLWELGVRHYPIIFNAPDTATYKFTDALHVYSSCDILAWQVEQIRRFRPLVVVGHDLNGEYGNAGHKVNAYYLTQAVTLAADPEAYPESGELYGIWDTPKFYLHLYPENAIYLDVDTPLDRDTLGRTAFQIAEDAYDHHHSQKKLAYRVRKGREWPAYDCTCFGLYRSLVGTDERADVMENLERADWDRVE